MCFDYDDDSTVLSGFTERTARKPHRCDDCGEMIQPRETYWHGAWVCDGGVWEFHGCVPCRAIRDEIKRREIASGCEAWQSVVPYGDGILSEYMSEVGPDLAASIRAAAKSVTKERA